MKKLKPILFAVLLLPNILFANSPKKDGERSKILFTGYPFSFISSTLKVGIEFKLPNLNGICLVPAITSTEYANIYDVRDLSIYGLEAQYRIYLKGNPEKNEAKSIVYMSPFINFSAASFKVTDYYHVPLEQRNATSFLVGYYFGAQKVYKSGFIFNIYAGGAVANPAGSYENLDTNLSFHKGVIPRAGIALGVAL